jgi:DNA (cytosine-5)-methyltransferase 1
MKSPLTYIDLFAGAGGLSEGFTRAGFQPVAHVEKDQAACYTLKTRSAYYYLKEAGHLNTYKEYLKGDITRQNLYQLIEPAILESVINLPLGPEFNQVIFQRINKYLNQKPVDIIIGGPPCQAYSVVGRARSKTKMQGDARNYLYLEYGKYLKKYQPKIFVFENVLGLCSANEGLYFKSMKKHFERLGYEINVFKVEANNFGVLQNRKRVIILGALPEYRHNIPDLEAIKQKKAYVVNDLLEDLPSIGSGSGVNKYMTYSKEINSYLKHFSIRNGIQELTQHVSRPNNRQDKAIYRIAVAKWLSKSERLNYNDLPEKLKTHNNRDSFTDRFKVVASNLPFSQTVVAHISKDGHYYIHPDIQQNRSITVREAARLQSFPDDYYFEGVDPEGSRTAAFNQIGNAVPPLMAEAIARSLSQII